MQLQSFGYTRVDPPFYLKDMHSQRRLALTATGTTGLRLVLNNNKENKKNSTDDDDNKDSDNDNDNYKGEATAMKETFRLQYEEAMKGQQGRRRGGVEDEKKEKQK